ncbi:hypothetical protein KL86PLE_120060 [uncultured Pleomorphomonas sp.]|uniref:Uncharacterized protein n=1 Tax=uncultured Pleomorphomonas sp. TaxID=442121 RepID=A0A212L831_9HYPH|nr:hypothetical protein KL86PLE_120060 [uncultured Pleomorphomonas sp.]
MRIDPEDAQIPIIRTTVRGALGVHPGRRAEDLADPEQPLHPVHRCQPLLSSYESYRQNGVRHRSRQPD